MSGLTTPSNQDSNGTPYLIFTSSTNNPLNKTLTITSKYPFGFVATNDQGLRIAQWNTQDGTSPLKAIVDFTGLISYPNVISLEIYDGETWNMLNTQTIQVFGGDVFNCILTFPPKMPVNQGYWEFSVDGQHMMINFADLNTVIFNNSDVHTGEQGGPGTFDQW